MPILHSLEKSLDVYEKVNAHFANAVNAERFFATQQADAVRKFRTLIAASGRKALERHNLPGHITGSALIVSPDFKKVLMTHHAKLGLWLQLGGHADGQEEIHEVALRESQEESGLEEFRFKNLKPLIGNVATDLPAIPFDVDVHVIPGRPEIGEHEHYDVRYLLVADPGLNVKISEESHDVRWFTLEEARQVTQEVSMHRQFAKAEYLEAF